jgi:hypothetical protein
MELLVFALPSRAEHALMSEERAHWDARHTRRQTMQSETNQTQKTDLEDELHIAEHTAKRRREDILESCRRAVGCLERLAADMRREVERAADLDPYRLIALPSEVLSQSAWTTSNLATEMGSANRMAAEYMNAIGALEALRGGAR